VPDDVPLAGPPGRVTESSWVLRYPLWDAYFALVAVAVAGYVALTARPPAAAAGAVALLAAMAAWYALFGRRLMIEETEDWRNIAYLVGLLVLYVPAVTLAGTSSFALFALCPQCFMVLPPVPATAAVVVFNAVHLVVIGLRTGDWREVLTGPGPAAAMIVVVSALFGTWATRTVRQSEERAALIRELDASRAEVARLSHDAGVLAERQRLAGEIHDTIAQGLSSVVMLIQAAQAEPARSSAHLALALDTARDNLGEARALVAALTPPPLSGASLPSALARVASLATAGFSVSGEPRPLPTAVEVVLLRSAQEALANARRHASASSVAVRLSYADTVTLTVTDDGVGFDAADSRYGYGLSGMRSRVEQVAGTLSLTSAPGAGTTVRVEVP
jgi:signal transduction histidine kinase